jgi:hypothetical protein
MCYMSKFLALCMNQIQELIVHASACMSRDRHYGSSCATIVQYIWQPNLLASATVMSNTQTSSSVVHCVLVALQRSKYNWFHLLLAAIVCFLLGRYSSSGAEKSKPAVTSANNSGTTPTTAPLMDSKAPKSK